MVRSFLTVSGLETSNSLMKLLQRFSEFNLNLRLIATALRRSDPIRRSSATDGSIFFGGEINIVNMRILAPFGGGKGGEAKIEENLDKTHAVPLCRRPTPHTLFKISRLSCPSSYTVALYKLQQDTRFFL